MQISLQAKTRTQKGRKSYELRTGGEVPGVLYGAGTKEPKSIAVDRKALAGAFRQAGESTLVDLVIDTDKPVKVLIQDMQYDPLMNEIIHADFRSVDLTKPITAEVKLRFIGESPAVKGLGGTMVHTKDSIEVKALPEALVASLDVDVSKLVTFEDSVKISDIAFPPGVTPEEDMNVTLALVEAPRSEEELAALDKAVEGDVTQVEVVGKKEKEEEAAAEGEAGAEAKGAPAKEEKKEEKKK